MIGGSISVESDKGFATGMVLKLIEATYSCELYAPDTPYIGLYVMGDSVAAQFAYRKCSERSNSFRFLVDIIYAKEAGYTYFEGRQGFLGYSLYNKALTGTGINY